ncbi:transcriptional repressor LexA [Pasteuria penetrans]|uniref:transcriptional repressor LexA n=1 Tax=Pasteuria penetrans TaxID=86005 RepID=UPI000F94CCE2|nr:transcriptional repressor LexA [Pasteuria penetrans]
MDRGLSPKELAVLGYIHKTVQTRGYPPSVREIGKAVGLSSSSTVHTYLLRLEKHGCIHRDPSKPRAIEVLWTPTPIHGGRDIREVPLVGKVTAGTPITAVGDSVMDFYPLPGEWVGPGPCFMLTVEGNSMINAGIHHGDKVIVREQKTARDGDIVVAMTSDHEATIKRFFYEGSMKRFRLQPENDHFEPIYLKKVQILGLIIGLIRIPLSPQ